jgi:hypothetical protein
MGFLEEFSDSGPTDPDEGAGAVEIGPDHQVPAVSPFPSWDL